MISSIPHFSLKSLPPSPREKEAKRKASPAPGTALRGLLLGRGLSEVGKEGGAEDLGVDDAGPHELGMVQPGEEADLEEEVEGDPPDEDAGALLDDGGEAEDDPVREPLLVIGGAVGVDGLEGHVGRVDEGDEVGDELGPADDVNEGGEDEADGQEEVDLGLAGLLLDFLQPLCCCVDGLKVNNRWVVCQLVLVKGE